MKHLYKYYIEETGEYAILSSDHGWIMRKFWMYWQLPVLIRARKRVADFLFPVHITINTPRKPERGSVVMVKKDGIGVSVWRVRMDGVGLFEDIHLTKEECGFYETPVAPNPNRPFASRAFPESNFRTAAKFGKAPVIDAAVSGWYARTEQFDSCECGFLGRRCAIHQKAVVCDCRVRDAKRLPRWEFLWPLFRLYSAGDRPVEMTNES
jgi:hypothetical protein